MSQVAHDEDCSFPDLLLRADLSDRIWPASDLPHKETACRNMLADPGMAVEQKEAEPDSQREGIYGPLSIHRVGYVLGSQTVSYSPTT